MVTGVNHTRAGNTKRQGGTATERSTESADGGDADAFKMHEMQQEARRRGEADACMLKSSAGTSSPSPHPPEAGTS